MKRFWNTAAAEAAEGGWRITLDGKPVRIPGGDLLVLPTWPLADAVAAEWQAAGGGVGGKTSFNDLPFTRIAGTGQARVAPDPSATVLELVRYAESDLLCYRAGAPPALVAREAAAWDKWIDWAAATYGGRLKVTTGVRPVAQPRGAVAGLIAALVDQSPLALAALGVAVPALGSLVLGLALAQGALDGPAAHALATVPEAFQAETWGEDADALARRRRIGDEVAVAARFLEVLRR